MIVDCHVHACATTPGHGSLSRQLLKKWNFRFIRWRLGLTGDDGEALERGAEAKLVESINGTEALDAAVVLALDAVYDTDGRLDAENTHLFVTNDYVAELSGKYP